jgi:hypothetical protein
MICNCCRRSVEFVRTSFWHGDASICRECLAAWVDPDNDQLGATDHLAIGNHIRLRHGLPPLAAAVILLLACASPALASRHCLDQAEAGRTWPGRALTRDGDGCWTYDRNPRAVAVPAASSELPVSKPEAVAEHDAELSEWWLESELVRSELLQLERERASHPDPASPDGPNFSVRQLALFVALVLATVSVLRVATWRVESPAPSRWPSPRKAE